MTTLDHDRVDYPHLVFTDAGRERLDEVFAFLDRAEAERHPRAEQARADLERQLRYLNDFGGTISKTDTRRRFRITIGRDFALLSFTITWESYSRATDDYAFTMQGALIWHGGTNDPLSVCLDRDALWAVHT